MKTLLNFYDLEICILQNFLRASLHFQNAMLTSHTLACFFTLGQKSPMRKNHQGVAQTEEKLPYKNQDWTLFINIYLCEQPFQKRHRLSLSTILDWHDEISMQPSK